MHSVHLRDPTDLCPRPAGDFDGSVVRAGVSHDDLIDHPRLDQLAPDDAADIANGGRLVQRGQADAYAGPPSAAWPKRGIEVPRDRPDGATVEPVWRSCRA